MDEADYAAALVALERRGTLVRDAAGQPLVTVTTVVGRY